MHAAAKRLGVTVTIVLDLIHVLEYLWKAAYVFHPEGSPEAEAWVTERLLWLLCGEAGQVIASIRRTATRRGLGRAARRPADICADYLERHRAHLHDDDYLARGLPIATGVIEGACRHLIRDPDLQGSLSNIYEVNVPMERPKEFAGRAWNSFTREEFASIRKRQQEEAAKRRLEAPGVQGGTPEIWLGAFDHTRGSVLWFVTDPADGRIPPLTPQVQAQQQARAARAKLIGEVGSIDLRAGRAESIEDRSLYDRCISRGLPGSMMPAPYGNSYQIVQTPGYVAIRYEMVHETRIIPLDNRPHAAPVHTRWMGDARGRFEGNTLVVETTNFREELTPRGANPKTLKLTERFTRVAPDKIHWSMTFDDPDTWTRPWTQTVPLTIDDSQAIIEYACHEANYSMWNTMTGRRFEEHEAARLQSPSSR